MNWQIYSIMNEDPWSHIYIEQQAVRLFSLVFYFKVGRSV